MKSVSYLSSAPFLFIQGLLLYHGHSVIAGSFPNSTSSPTNGVKPAPAACGKPTCSVSLRAETLSYPTVFALIEKTQTATIIPIVNVYPNGKRVTVSSTYDGANQTFVAPSNTPLTWVTFNTTLTWPTTYVAYPNPSLLIVTPTPTTSPDDSPCTTDFLSIHIPPTGSPRLIYPLNASMTTLPGTDSAFAYISTLPALTSLLSGGDPATCHYGVPAIETRTMQTPVILPQAPISHTSVSVLTTVGHPVTNTVPFDDTSIPTVQSPPPGQEPGDNPPQTQQQDTPPPTQGPTQPAPGQPPAGQTQPAQPPPQTIVGSNTIQPVPGGVVVNGQTFTPGVVSTLNGGVLVSVAPSATVVVVDGATVSIPPTSPSEATKMIVGGETIQQMSSAIVVNGQTFTQGAFTTLSDGVVVSIARSTTILVVDGATVPLSGVTSTSSGGPGAAIASGMSGGSTGAHHKPGTLLLTLEGLLVFTFSGVLAFL